MTRRTSPTVGALSRRSLLAAGTGAIAGTLGGIAAPALALSREQLVLIDWGAAYHKFFAGEFKATFEKKYACDLVVQPMGTAEKNARLLAEAERPTMDVVMIEPMFAAKLATMDVVARITPAQCPNLKNLFPVIQNFFDGVGVPHGIVARGLAYNHDKVKGVPTWEAMWQPEYRGHVGGPSHGSEEMSMQFLAAASLINGGTVSNLEPGWQKLKAFRAQKPIWWSTNGNRNEYQQRGDLWMTVSSNGHTYALADRGVPLSFTLPPNQSFLSGSALVAPKAIGASKLDFAYKLMDMIISDEWQSKAAPSTFWAPVVQGIKLDPEVARRTASDEVGRMKLLDYTYLNANLDKLAERYQDEVVAS
jgi:putative spermidine/putrescine transport system substrate-binding protein